MSPVSGMHVIVLSCAVQGQASSYIIFSVSFYYIFAVCNRNKIIALILLKNKHISEIIYHIKVYLSCTVPVKTVPYYHV